MDVSRRVLQYLAMHSVSVMSVANASNTCSCCVNVLTGPWKLPGTCNYLFTRGIIEEM